MTAISDKANAAWSRIIPFLRPIEPLLRDAEVSDIMVNGEQAVFFEKHGIIYPFPDVTIREQSLQVAARNIARALGDEIGEERPILDSRLPDGSRVAIVLAPVSVNGTTITIRKFQNKRYHADELVRTGTLSPELLALLREAVQVRRNIVISGGTGTGKTTLLNALAAFIPDEERVVVIEDTSEIQIEKPNVVRLEAREEQEGLPPVPIRSLLRATLRMRPDRIILGEVRGGEAFDLLQAMNTGHSGSISTVHASSAPRTLTRLATCVMMSGIDLPHRTVRANIAEAVHLIVHIQRCQGRRAVSAVLRVGNYDSDNDRYELYTLIGKESDDQKAVVRF